MTRYMLRRLARAAILRARGVDWIGVAKAVNSRPVVCRRWPDRYPEAWQAFYGQAQRMLIEDLTRRAVWELSRMARSSDPKIRRKAAKTLREYERWRNGKGSQPRIPE